MNLTNLPLGQLARDIPGASAVLHRHKLDFCCHGDASLMAAATAKGLDPNAIASQLSALQARTDQATPEEQTSNEALIEHILTRFHDVHREQLPELIRLAQRVERVHSKHPRCPSGLGAHLENMQNELESHMQKEEQILFPMIARGITGMAAAPVSVMRNEHEDHGAALAEIHSLTFNLTLPEGACNTWRALYLGLTELENDLMEHIHLENNVLFHRVDGLLGARNVADYRKLWWILIAILAITFTLLGYFGREVYREAPPIPDQVVSAAGDLLMTEESILDGQTAWQSMGGMQVGSIWGHGAYQAPDWTADWLHRELETWLEIAAQEEFGHAWHSLSGQQQNALQYDLKTEYRNNTYDDATGTLHLSDRRTRAIAETADYYSRLFSDAPELQSTRASYAMKENTLPSPERRQQMTEFFFWTAWAAATERPGSNVTYTNNWPHEPLIDNTPSGENVVWSVISVILLIAGVGGLIWAWAFLRKHDDDEPAAPLKDPISALALTPSQRALGKYLLLVVGLFTFQVMLGGFTAHYTVEGQGFYGINTSEWLPYSLVRTWHIQAALFWIATGFLAAGLFLAPIINGGKDPKFQKLGVDVLFWALVVVVGGSFIGNFLAIAQIMPPHLSFWLGHQGYEFVDLGRLWQIGKFLGIVFWLVLMLRGIVPALRQPGDKNLLALLTASVVAIGLFYGAGFFYGERTHISIMEYWRWWIVHLWVEGFFEVFATAALAFIFCSMGLVSRTIATSASLASASLFMLGGVPGTFHHLYFSGTTTPVMAVGATFSALEVVPLVVLGYEAWENWRLKTRAPWMENIRWPLMFFVAVAFWNMLGAGVLGFMINPPIALYYIQGLNTTPTHAHAALFGVYGFLALGFTLLILRYIRPSIVFDERLMKISFWWLNIGLVLMLFTSLLPIGIIQFLASASEGLWYARSEAFLQSDVLQTLRWIRTIGDVVFIVGALGVTWQVVKGIFFPNLEPAPYPDDEAISERA